MFKRNWLNFPHRSGLQNLGMKVIGQASRGVKP